MHLWSHLMPCYSYSRYEPQTWCTATLPVLTARLPGWVRWWMVNCCLHSWISWCWFCLVHSVQLKKKKNIHRLIMWQQHVGCICKAKIKVELSCSYIFVNARKVLNFLISFVAQTRNTEWFERKTCLPRLSCLSVYGYYCLEMFAQHKLVRDLSAPWSEH